MIRKKAMPALLFVPAFLVLSGCGMLGGNSDTTSSDVVSSEPSVESTNASSSSSDEQTSESASDAMDEETNASSGTTGSINQTSLDATELFNNKDQSFEDWRSSLEDKQYLSEGEILLDSYASDSKTFRIDKPIASGEELQIAVVCQDEITYGTSIGNQGKSIFSTQDVSCNPSGLTIIDVSQINEDIDSWTFNVYVENPTEFRAIVLSK